MYKAALKRSTNWVYQFSWFLTLDSKKTLKILQIIEYVLTVEQKKINFIIKQAK